MLSPYLLGTAYFALTNERGRLYMGREQSVVSELTVNIDVEDAIRGLKAIQREARKATAALAELKAAQEVVGR